MKTLSACFVLLGGIAAASAQSRKPVDVSFGWAYAYNDQGDGFASLNGWYGNVNFEQWSRVAVALNHQSYWGGFQGSEANAHVWLAGVSIKLREGNPRFQPFVSPLGGSTRSSSSGSVQWQPTFQLGAGADITLKGNLALEVIPAEYTYTHSSYGSANSYQAAAGVQYSFRR
jgi:hypothetical protein